MNTFFLICVLIFLISFPFALYGLFSLICWLLNCISNPVHLFGLYRQGVPMVKTGLWQARKVSRTINQKLEPHLPSLERMKETGVAPNLATSLYLKVHKILASYWFDGLFNHQKSKKSKARRPPIQLKVEINWWEFAFSTGNALQRWLKHLRSFLARVLTAEPTADRFFVRGGGLRETGQYTTDPLKKNRAGHCFGAQRNPTDIRHGYVGQIRKNGRYAPRPRTRIVEHNDRILDLED